MRFTAIALDYDGTIALGDTLDPSVRTAIGEVREKGVAVILVTGRRSADLRRVAGDLSCFDAVVAENGAVLEFPASGRVVKLSHPPSRHFTEELSRRAIPFVSGDCLVETDASAAPAVLEIIRSLEEPLVLVFNRQRLMVLPQTVGKSTGLRQALYSLRLSIHNTLGIGDAENDHDLLDACELGAAVEWGSPTLRRAADDVVCGDGPPAVAAYIRQLVEHPEVAAMRLTRRRLILGTQPTGETVSVAVRGRPMVIAGEPGSGKSWLGGLVCEHLILMGYCLCIIDPEGDYGPLEALPGVITLGGDDPPPGPRDLERALGHPYATLILDLSRLSQHDKRDYVAGLLPLLAAFRRRNGLPHKILLDEAHYFLNEESSPAVTGLDHDGFIFVTYRVSGLARSVRTARDTLVIVTRESETAEAQALAAACEPSSRPLSSQLLANLGVNEAVLLPSTETVDGTVVRFRLGPRLTSHVRHRAKYFDMPVPRDRSFAVQDDGRAPLQAASLSEFVVLLASISSEALLNHARRHDFSRWVRDVFRDGTLSAHLYRLEEQASAGRRSNLLDAITQAVRARYELVGKA
jgi:hydroxymethylpyrimidine pyrophosphatase-like HAD family hydrolase